MTDTFFSHVRAAHGVLSDQIRERISLLETSGRLETEQLESYQLSLSASALLAIPIMIDYANYGKQEQAIATLYCMQTLRETAASLLAAGL
ncbi:MAG: hypothetical protein ACYCU8_14175, partial [Ferrimicrobium acidiphilum]